VVVIQDLRVYAPRSALVAEQMVSAALFRRLVVQDVSPSLDFARSFRLHQFAKAGAKF
jgi:hypothetical protein